MEYKSKGDKNRMLSVEEYLDKIRPYLRNIINDLKTICYIMENSINNGN